MAIKISHETAAAGQDRGSGRNLWVQIPIRVVVDGVELRASEWSVAGVVIEQAAIGGTPHVGQFVDLRVELPFEDFDIGFDAEGEIQTFDAQTLRAQIGFRHLQARERDLLQHFTEQLVRGTMAPVDSTLQHMGASPPMPAAATTWKTRMPRGRRAAMMTALYGVAGLGVFGYLAALAYSNLFWLEARTSTISAPIEAMVSLGDGFVNWTTFKPGDPVKAGDVVLRIYDNVVEREIEEAEITVRERENKLAFLLKRQESEKKRMGTLAGMSSQKNVHLLAEIEGLEAKLKAANRELKQLPSAAVGPLAQVRQRIVGLRQAISLKELEVQGRATVAAQSAGKFEVVGQSVVDTDSVGAQIELAEGDVDIATRRHESHLKQRDRLAVRAPFDGVLRQLPRADNATVKKGDLAAVIERNEGRGVTAYLRQDQLLRVQLGADALVYVPATRQTFRASVSGIEAEYASAKDTARQTGASGAGHREDGMAAVRLTLKGDQQRNLALFHDGLPVSTSIELGRESLRWMAPRPSLAHAVATERDVAAGAEPSIAAAFVPEAPAARHQSFAELLQSALAGWRRPAQTPAVHGTSVP